MLSSLALSFFYFCLSSILICKNFRDPFQALYSFVLLSCCSIFKDHSPPLLRQLDYYTTFFPACQYLLQKFFQLFSKFFQSGLWWLSFWGRAFIFYHKEDKLSIAFLKKFNFFHILKALGNNCHITLIANLLENYSKVFKILPQFQKFVALPRKHPAYR